MDLHFPWSPSLNKDEVYFLRSDGHHRDQDPGLKAALSAVAVEKLEEATAQQARATEPVFRRSRSYFFGGTPSYHLVLDGIFPWK